MKMNISLFIFSLLFSVIGYTNMIPDQWNDLSPTKINEDLNHFVKDELQKRLKGDFSPKDIDTFEKDLVALGSLQFKATTALFKKIYGFDQGSGIQLLEWFFSKVEYLEKSEYGACGPKSYVCAEYQGSLLSKLLLSKNIYFIRDYANISSSRIFRLSVLLHEARHLDGFSHAKDKMSDLVIDGAIGAQMTFLSNLNLYCTTCSLKDRSFSYKFQEEFKHRYTQLNYEDEEMIKKELELSVNPVSNLINEMIKNLNSGNDFVELRECRNEQEIADENVIDSAPGSPCIIVITSRSSLSAGKIYLNDILVIFQKR